MHKCRKKHVFYIFFIIALSLGILTPKSNADVITVDYNGTGNFFPAEACSLIMTNASVIFDINYQESLNKIDINFKGNYTIYNPNSSQNITIAAPFSSDFVNLEQSCKIKADNEQKQFTVYQYNWSDPWADYLDSADLGITERNFILSNITFPENSSIKLQYSFQAYMTTDISGDNLVIFYDVGTSRAWNGSITERVEFKTYGKLPNSCSNDWGNYYHPPDNYSFTITEFSNYRSYTWEWINETINTNEVFISYSLSMYIPISVIIPLFFGLCFGIPIIIGVVIKKINRRRKRLSVKPPE